MLDAVVLSGDEDTVEAKLRELLSFGSSEILVSPIAAGSDRESSHERTLQLLARVCRSLDN